MIIIDIIILAILIGISLLLYIFLRDAFYCLMAISDIKEENVKEAMVVRNGKGLLLDVANVGLRQIGVNINTKNGVNNSMKEGEMYDVYQGKWLDEAFETGGVKSVIFANGKGEAIRTIIVKLLFILPMSSALGFLLYIFAAKIFQDIAPLLKDFY